MTDFGLCICGKTCIVHTLVTQNLFGMTDRCEIFSDCRTTIPLSPLKFSNLYILFPEVFMDLQMSKIGCVNYAQVS